MFASQIAQEQRDELVRDMINARQSEFYHSSTQQQRKIHKYTLQQIDREIDK